MHTQIIEDIYKNIYTNVTRNELEKLYELSKGAENIIELGSYQGASTIAMASNMKKDGILIAIDIWLSNPSMRPDPKDCTVYEEFLSNIGKFNVDSIIKPIKEKTVDAVKQLSPDFKADIIFIDADHAEPAVLIDYQTFFPFLKKDGYIVFHDYASFSGVKKVIDNYVIEKTYNYQNLPNMWWGQKL